MGRKPRRKRLEITKSRSRHAKAKADKEKSQSTLPRALPNEISTSNNSEDEEGGLKSKTSEVAVSQGNLESDGASPVQVSVAENLSFPPPPQTPPISPVTPNVNLRTESLLLPSTGILRNRGNVSLAFDEGAVVNSTPIKWTLPDETLEEQSVEPSAATNSTEGFINSESTADNSANKVFTVSSISIVEPSHSGIFLRPPEEKNSIPGKSPPRHECQFLAVEYLLKSQLPSIWGVATNLAKTTFTLGMLAAEDLWGVHQRTVLISKDGTVEMKVHNCPISSDHPVWQSLPCKVGLANGESINEFAQYVLAVAKEIRSYSVCVGIPEPKYAKLAAKHPGLVFDRNPFMESRYKVTYRSVDCKILLATNSLNKKFCPSCSKSRHALLKRSKIRNPVKSPHPCANNKHLDSAQKNHKMSKTKQDCRNAKRRERYHRKALALIQEQGVSVEESTSKELTDILDRHYNSLPPPPSGEEEGKLQRIFIEQQLKASKVKGPTGMRWHPVMIRFALQLYMTSSAAYEAVQGTGIIRLPSSKTLFDYSHYTVAKQGINFAALGEVVAQVKEFPADHHKRYFLLLMDEMSISKNLVYSRISGELTGFVHLDEVDREVAALEREMDTHENLPTTYSNGDFNTDAFLQRERLQEVKDYGDVIPGISDKVLAFMAVGLTNGIRQVIASYGEDRVSPYMLSTKVWEIVGILEGSRAPVLGIVCDGHPSNRKFIDLHTPLTKLQSGVVFDTANRFNPRRPFYFFADVPHLLKTLRNNFHNSESGAKSRLLKRDGQFITWRTITELYEREKNNEVRLAHKLNAQVVYLNSFSQMKVSYAAQVFSKTVANAIEKLYPEKTVTIDFIRRVNDFFDCMNGASLLHGVHTKNKLLDPYRTADDIRFRKLMSFRHYLNQWRATSTNETDCLSLQTVVGVEMAVHSFIACVKFMLQKGAPYILARVFCQDPLEQHFSKQRGACGGSRNPNLATYLQNENKFLNLKGLGFKRQRGNTKVVRDADYVDKICGPLIKRKRSDAREKRVSTARRALLKASGSTA